MDSIFWSETKRSMFLGMAELNSNKQIPFFLFLFPNGDFGVIK